MPFISVGEENSGKIDLYYEDHGKGKPVILIHGWPLSSASWEKQLPALLATGHRVITYDRRGFGFSSQTAFGYDYDTLAEDLNRIMSKLDVHDATLVGFSMGGGEVARYLATRGSKRVSQAIFIAAIPPFLLKMSDNPEGMDMSVFDEIKNAIINDRPAFLWKFLSDFYNVDTLGVSQQVVQSSWNIACQASPIGTLECVQSWLTDFRKDLQSIRIPTLVMHGDSDRILPFDATAKRMPGFVKECKLEIVQGGPHGLTWTHAEQVNRVLLDFLQQRTSAIPRKDVA
ncbi:MAG: alpha/beta hydrolase [Acidobacteria bacterium]|nr:MAG: alpha/beta hydrolase [Acidobacteriota bacterium]